MNRWNKKVLPLEGAHNVRDLGGYPSRYGGRVREGSFLRGESLWQLTEADKRYLAEYGVRRIVDFRSSMEVADHPDDFGAFPEIAYHNLPLLDQIHSGDAAAFPPSMSELYCSLLEQEGRTFAAFIRIAGEMPGAVLFHCTAGKDRTGIAAMLLLKLAGVEEDWIVGDYAATDRCLAGSLEAMKGSLREKNIQVPDYVLRALPEEMEKTLAYFDEKWGSAEAYLLQNKMKREEIQQTRNKLLGV